MCVVKGYEPVMTLLKSARDGIASASGETDIVASASVVLTLSRLHFPDRYQLSD